MPVTVKVQIIERRRPGLQYGLEGGVHLGPFAMAERYRRDASAYSVFYIRRAG